MDHHTMLVEVANPVPDLLALFGEGYGWKVIFASSWYFLILVVL
jgi:hypothetical protein